MGRLGECHPSLLEGLVHLVNVIDGEIQDLAWMRELVVLWHVEQQANAVAVEERQRRRRSKQELQTECIPIEPDGSIEILRVHGDLPDLRKSEAIHQFASTLFTK